MSEIVLILGAGASVHAGGPLMSDFITKAREFYKKNRGDEYKGDFDRVFAAIGKLQQVHSKSDLDLGNLEEVFGAFEMARMIRTFPGLAGDEIDPLLESFKRVIVRILETQIRFPTNDRGALLPTQAYGQMANVVGQLNSDRLKPRCSIITFNYDVALDHALRFAGVPVDYGLKGGGAGGTPLLKLHGSINWAKVRDEDAVFAWDLRDFTSRIEPLVDFGSRYRMLSIGSAIMHGRHNPAGRPIDTIPVIIPPTWNKTNYYTSISAVWQRAAKELAGAEYIFVSGYSLTGTDTYFKYLFSLGSTSDQILQRFEVFDPGTVEEKFKRILGPAAKSVFRHYPNHFLGLVETLATLAPKRASV